LKTVEISLSVIITVIVVSALFILLGWLVQERKRKSTWDRRLIVILGVTKDITDE
jgi:hypothetical protein